MGFNHFSNQCCRVCSDCGSRTPGAGTSSRWHAHYTVCDSCYQQRNKGFSCPICNRAYRAAAYREMVKCSLCNKFVHSECDPDASPPTYHAKKEANPEYEYSCQQCKQLVQNGRMNALRRSNNNIDDDSMSASQESLYGDDHSDNVSMASISASESSEKYSSDFGLGKGKPLSANKMIAKKRLPGVVGRPKGGGKFSFQKKQRTAEFGRKRGPKAKMRGVFGVPGLGLQRPTSDANNKADEEPGVENRLVLCSAKDKFVLTQDICVMCGAIGTDQEGCLISCLQCGQCYHPYCVTVKVTKVILQRGWRCLDCTVCEGCGMKHDESRLILCDDCDISYHIYCMDPPLDIVPDGTWKCKWCAICQKCGSNTPGTNCTWQNSFTECGPCASQSQCAFCSYAYNDGELLIQCTYCERWLHATCDEIRNEEEAERCIDEGYKCLLCRPKDALPPHLIPVKKPTPNVANTKAITNTPTTPKSTDESQEATPTTQIDGCHIVDGVSLSDAGMHHIKSLQMELVRKKRKTKVLPIEPPPVKAQEAGIMAAIESVVAGGSLDNSLEDVKVEPLDPREEAEIYKDGMIWDKDLSPPEGFTIGTNEHGVAVLRKKRQRNLQKLGIGGFVVRNRAARKDGTNKDENEETTTEGALHFTTTSADQKKKQIRKKLKTKLADTYPSYLQEAFFGKDLMNVSKTKYESSSSEDEATKCNVTDDKTIQLSTEEINILNAQRLKQQKLAEEKNKQNATAAAAPSTTQSQLTNTTTIVSQVKPIISNIGTNQIGTARLTEIKADPTQQDTEMMDISNLPVSTCNVAAVHKNELNDINLENLDFKMDMSNANAILSDESQKLQRQTSLPNTLMAQSGINNVATNLPTNIEKPPTIPVHANVNTVQTMVVNSVQKKTIMAPIMSMAPMTPDNQQIKSMSGADMQTITVPQQQQQQQQTAVIAAQAIIEKQPIQQPPIQMQLNQRVTSNQPQLNQTTQSLSQIEPMQQSPVGTPNAAQKIG